MFGLVLPTYFPCCAAVEQHPGIKSQFPLSLLLIPVEIPVPEPQQAQDGAPGATGDVW